MKKCSRFLCLALLLYQVTGLMAQKLDKKFPSTDGPVYATTVVGDTVYVGGAFTYIFTPAKGLARFNTGSVKPDITYPQLGGSYTVYAAEPDGNGGLYLAGYFDTYNGVALSTPTAVLHLLADGSKDPAFNALGTNIQLLKKKGNVLYIGGNFTTADIPGRNYLAALNATTGALLPWVPDAIDGTLNNLDATDSLVFIGGPFYNVGNIYQYNFAALKASTGKLIKNFPSSNGNYYPYKNFKADANNTLYLGGYNMSNVQNNVQSLVKIDTAAAALNLDFPFTDGAVYATVADGASGYYIGGSFGKVGKEASSYLAHVLADGTVDTAFKPTVNGPVNCLALTADSLYFGGDFTLVNTKTRNRAAAVSRTKGVLSLWNPNVNASVYCIAVNGSTVYLGGTFTKFGTTTRNYLGAWNINNTINATWLPNPNSYVRSIVPNSTGSSVFIGGDFTTIKTLARQYLVKVNTTNGDPATWAPLPNNAVYSLALSGPTVYFGGSFSQVNSINRSQLAAVDTGTAALSGFLADANALPIDIKISNGKLYVVGQFTQIQGVLRNYIARFNLATGLIDSWGANKNINGTVNAVGFDGANVLLGGSFSAINVTPRNYMAAIDLTKPGYPLTSWNPNVSWTSGSLDLQSMLHNGRDLIIGGGFSYTENGKTVSNLISLHDSTGVITHSLAQYPNSTVSSLALYDGKLMLGGDFTGFNKISDNTAFNSISYLGAYDLNTWQVLPQNYNPDNVIANIFTNAAGQLIASGSFSRMNNFNRNYLAAVNLSTGLPTDFNPSMDNQVFTLAARDSSLFAGGYFSSVNTNTTPVARTYIAGINTRTSKATTWAANSNGYIYSMMVKDSTLYVGGQFSSIKGAARNNAAAFSTKTTGAITSWSPNTNSIVYALLPYGSNVYIGGAFTTLGAATRNYLGLVNNTSGAVNSWNPNMDGGVYSFVNIGNKFYAGGNFYNVGALPRNSLCSFDTTSKALTTFDANLNSGAVVEGTVGWGKTIFFNSDNLQSINGVARQFIGAVDTATRTATAFNPLPNGPSYSPQSISLAKNKLIMGGTFSQLGDGTNGPSYLAVFNLEPLNQATALTFTNKTPNGVKVSVTKGSGEGRLFVVRKGNTSPSAPVDSLVYTGNAMFGGGSKIGDSTYVVYSGALDSVSVTGLLPNTKYQFAVYEFNGSGPGTEYLTAPVLTGSITTPCPVYSLKTSPADSVKICAGSTAIINAPPGFKKYLWNTGDTTVQVAKGIGTFSVTFTDSLGCTGVASIIVLANPKPNLGKDTTLQICAGSAGNLRKLYDTTGYTIVQWNTAKPDSVGAGTYTLIVTNSTGCKDTAVITVVASAKPNLGADKNVSICVGAKTNIAALYTTTGYPTVIWSTPRPDSVTAKGSYTLIVANAGGCSDTAIVKVDTVSAPIIPIITFLKGSANVCAADSAVLSASNLPAGNSIIWFRNDTLIAGATLTTYTVKKTGNYKLQYKNATGCTSVSTAITITVSGVKPAKPSFTTTGNKVFCTGDSLVLNTTAAGSLQWARNTANIKNATKPRYLVKVSGFYALRVYSGPGCFAESDTVIATSTTVAKPTITLVNDTLVSSAATGNQWFAGGYLIPGATLQKYSPDEIDLYTVQVTAGGCKSPLSDPFVYTANTFRKAGLRASIYPNPTSGAARFTVSGTTKPVSIEITDLTGKLLQRHSNLSSKQPSVLNVSTLPAGVYIVTFSDGVQKKALKLIKSN
jgi:hypothetical protein